MSTSMSKAGPTVTVRLPGAWLGAVVLAGALLGFGAAFAVGPVAHWLMDVFGGAPAPLRLAARLPLGWAVAVLTVVGGVGGAVVAGAWKDESPVVEVGAGSVVVRRDGTGRHVERADVAEVFIDRRELVLRGADGREHVRTWVESALNGRLREAFERQGYPWLGTTDPHEAEFIPWVDHGPGLDEPAHALLRTRQRALIDEKSGAADAARDELRALGISVRDRGKAQQYRRA
ncbi:YqeB family protein [Streptomyces sp. NPDC003660]